MRLVPSERLLSAFYALAALAAAAACLLSTDTVERLTGYDTLTSATTEMVDASLVRDMKTFLAVSTIKAGMAVFEGSTIEAGLGIGVEVEAGDVIQPVYDYIDFAWRMLVYALLVLGFYKLLFETGILAIGLQILGLGLLMWGLGRFLSARRDTLRRWGRAFVLLGVLVAYLVPAALWGTHYLSSHYTQRLKDKQYAQIVDFQREFEVFKEQSLSLKDKVSVLRPGESADQVRLAFARMADSLAASTRASLFAFLYYVLIIVFELLFLPFLSAFLMYKFAHAALDELFGARVSRRQEQDAAASAS